MVFDDKISPVGDPSEKNASNISSAQPLGSPGEPNHGESGTGRIHQYLRAFEKQLVEYNLEARGIARVREDERMKKLSWISYMQACLLWVSINLAPNNITLGMLGPAVYGLSFQDASLCAVFGAFVGSLVASWLATWGPISGLRTMVCTI